MCGHFGFLDARSRAQTAGCVKALRELERAGHFVLPTDVADEGAVLGAVHPGWHRPELFGDREADFFKLFDEQRQSRRVDLLVRAKHDRATNDELNLFESVRHSPVQSQLRINVPRQSSRAKKSKQRARTEHEQRMAQVDLPPASE